MKGAQQVLIMDSIQIVGSESTKAHPREAITPRIYTEDEVLSFISACWPAMAWIVYADQEVILLDRRRFSAGTNLVNGYTKSLTPPTRFSKRQLFQNGQRIRTGTGRH